MQFKNCSFASVSEIPSLSLCFNCICISINICIKTWSKEFSPLYFIKVIFVFALSSVYMYLYSSFYLYFVLEWRCHRAAFLLSPGASATSALPALFNPSPPQSCISFVFSRISCLSLSPCICFVFLSNDDNNNNLFLSTFTKLLAFSETRSTYPLRILLGSITMYGVVQIHFLRLK